MLIFARTRYGDMPQLRRVARAGAARDERVAAGVLFACFRHGAMLLSALHTLPPYADTIDYADYYAAAFAAATFR